MPPRLNSSIWKHPWAEVWVQISCLWLIESNGRYTQTQAVPGHADNGFQSDVQIKACHHCHHRASIRPQTVRHSTLLLQKKCSPCTLTINNSNKVCCGHCGHIWACVMVSARVCLHPVVWADAYQTGAPPPTQPHFLMGGKQKPGQLISLITGVITPRPATASTNIWW